MSRYRVPPLDNGITVDVGWDNPLQTFFAQVKRVQGDEDERDPIILWIGCLWQEIRTIELLASLVAPFAVLHPAILANLRRELADSTRPTPLQMQLREGQGQP